MIHHLVMFSGGVGSWATLKRVVQKHGKSHCGALFAETYMEDEDLYRFVFESVLSAFGADRYRKTFAVKIPAVGTPERKAVLDRLFAILRALVPQFHRVAEGRNVWELFADQHCIGNGKVDLCSSKLKRDVLDKWRDANCTPEQTTIYIGIDWTEKHRLDTLHKFCAPWRYEAPLIEPPYSTKAELLEELRADGIEPPRLYRLGFAHNNCGGFCVKSGQGQFLLLLRTMPERYAWHEAQEERVRAIQVEHGIIPSSVLYHRRGRKGTPGRTRITMKEFREMAEQQPELKPDGDLAAGCGCAISYGPAETKGVI